jgi:hypothetical protein
MLGLNRLERVGKRRSGKGNGNGDGKGGEGGNKSGTIEHRGLRVGKYGNMANIGSSLAG